MKSDNRHVSRAGHPRVRFYLRPPANSLASTLADLDDLTRIEGVMRAILEAFDHNLENVLSELLENRLRFNTFVRLFFSALVVVVDRPGMDWRKGKKKGELPICNARIRRFAFEPRFAAFVNQSGIELPLDLKRAERYSENLSESQGSPRM